MQIIISNKGGNMSLEYSGEFTDIERLDLIRDALRLITREYDSRIMDIFHFDMKNPV